MPSTRSQCEDLVQQIDEIERFLNLQRRIREYRIKYNLPDPNIPIPKLVVEPEMAEGPQNCPLKYYAIPSQEEPHNSIAASAIEANNFELKPSYCQSYNIINFPVVLQKTRTYICQYSCNTQTQ